MTDTASGTTYRILPFDELQDFTRAVFAAYGYGPADAAAIADVILRAALYGIESHGIQRLMRYHQGCWTHFFASPAAAGKALDAHTAGPPSD